MKKLMVLVATLLALSQPLFSKGFKPNWDSERCMLVDLVTSMESGEPTAQDLEFIKLMVEKKVFLKELYTKLYDEWGFRAFERMLTSEERHLKLLEALSSKYSVEFSLEDEPFIDYEFGAALYDDIQTALDFEKEFVNLLDDSCETTDLEDLKVICEAFRRSSERHIGALERLLERLEVM